MKHLAYLFLVLAFSACTTVTRNADGSTTETTVDGKTFRVLAGFTSLYLNSRNP